MASAIVRGEKFGGVREWWAFAADDHTKGVQFNTLDMKILKARLATTWPPVLKVINTGEIVRRVDALFSAAV